MTAKSVRLLSATCALTAAAWAHHSFSAQFDANKPVTLEGVVTKIAWANPHVYFYVDVKQGDGTVVNWACETNGPNGLIRQGWKRDSLKEGDRVTVSAYLAKDGSKTVDARMVTLPDGRKVFTGSANDGGPTAADRK
jgi:hypothetical protein